MPSDQAFDTTIDLGIGMFLLELVFTTKLENPHVTVLSTGFFISADGCISVKAGALEEQRTIEDLETFSS